MKRDRESGGVNIRQAGRSWSRRVLGLAACALLAGCGLAPEAGVQRVAEAVTPAGKVTLPHQWNDPRQVAGLRVTVPFDAADTDDAFGVAFGRTTVTFRASVNGTAVHESGDSSSPNINETSYRSRPSFRIPAHLLRPGTNELQLELALPAGTHYAMLGRIYVGDDEAIDRLQWQRLLAFQVGPLAIGVVLFAVGLVALGLWRGRRDSELFLLLAAGALLWALQIFMLQWPTRLLPRPHWGVFVNSVYVWFPALIGVFFLRFAFRRSRGFEMAAVVLAAVAAPLYYASFAAGVVYEYFIALRLGVLAFISFALLALLRYALQLRTATGYILFGMGALCVAVAVRDFVVSLSPGIDDSIVLNPYSGVALLLFAGWMLLERYHKAYADFEMLNRDLEHRVEAANLELHRRLEQVEAARASAEQANVAKSRFFAAASHDLRQPLHSLGLFASALRETVGPGEGRDLVRRIGDSIGALDRLFDELLDVSRLDAGTVEVRPRNYELQQLFDRLAEEYFAEAEAKALRLRFHPTRLAVYADPLLLARVLANLVSNAIRYTRHGGVLVGARRRGDRVLLQVWDTGIGIAPDQRELIFDEFYQVGNPGRDRRRGLGLGLAIVRRLTTLMGQPLTLRSETGRGTCFCLALPLAQGPVETVTPDDAGAPPRDFVGRRALVVDDDTDICEATVRLLTRWGFEARAAHGDQAASALLVGGFVPEVILADLRLGEAMDGIDVVEALRRQCGRPVPALLISGDTGARELARVKESGLLLLTKPVAPARLRSALHALLVAPG